METRYSPKVTAIIPCYNDGEYLLEALNSLLNQTLVPDKIIIVDDGSNKSTKEVLSKIDHHIVEVIYQQNAGVAAARNAGIEKAMTEYILTLDADDYFEPTFVEKAVGIIKSAINIGIVGCYYRRFGQDADDNEIIKPQGGIASNFLVMNNGVGNALFERECWVKVNGYDESFKKGYEDWDFWLSILSQGFEMRIIPEPLFNYRKKVDSRDSRAIAQHDYELRMILFYKHRKVYEDNFEHYVKQITLRNTQLTKKVNKIKASLDYKLGEKIILPLRIIKNTLKL